MTRNSIRRCLAALTVTTLLSASTLLAQAPAPATPSSSSAPPTPTLTGRIDGPRAAIHEALPDSAAVVVIVPHVGELSRKIAALSDGLGLPYAQLADALTSLKQISGLSAGINDDGSAALVIFAPASTPTPAPAPAPGSGGGPGEAASGPEGPGLRAAGDRAVLLVPVGDYAAMVTGIGGKADEPVTAVTLRDGRKGFARQVGGFALLGAGREMVERYHPAGPGGPAATAGEAGELGVLELSRGDLVVMVNVEALEPMALTGTARMRQGLAAAGDAGGGDPALVELSGVVMNTYLDHLENAIRDARRLVLSIDLGERAIGLSFTVGMTPGSPTARLTAIAADTVSGTVLDRLPGGGYLAAAAINLEGAPIAGLIDALLQRLPAAQSSAVAGMARTQLQLQRMVRSAGRVDFPSASSNLMEMMSGGMTRGVTVLEVEGDAADYVRLHRAYLEALGRLVLPVAGTEGSITFQTVYNPSALEIDGVRVDQFMSQVVMPEEMTRQMGPLGPMVMSLAGAGQRQYIAARGRQVVFTSTTDAQLMREALRALSGGGLGASPSIRGARSEAFAVAPFAEVYLSVSNLTQWLSGLASAAGVGGGGGGGGLPALNIPSDAPPLAVGLMRRADTVSGRVVVPMEVVDLGKQVAAALAPLFSAMGGGMGGEGPEPVPF